jgi:hypothetical protein
VSTRGQATATVETVTLAGPPLDVSGVVPLRNDGSEDLTVTEVVVRDPDTDRTFTIPLPETVVAPGTTSLIKVRVTLQPASPPGSFPLLLELGGQQLDAGAHVLETADVALTPRAIVVDNIPAATIRKQVVVNNAGNVTAFVADFGEVPLFEEEIEAGVLIRLLSEGLPEESDDGGVRPEPSGTITVATVDAPVPIAPGATTAVQLDFTVPEGLKQTVRYIASLPISIRTLKVALVPAGAGAVAEPAPTPARRTRTTRARATPTKSSSRTSKSRSTRSSTTRRS